MKKQVTLLAAVLLFLVACTGCGKTDIEARTDSSGGNQVDQDGKLQVVASFYPMYDFAKKIGGDYAEVKNLVPSGMEPHDWNREHRIWWHWNGQICSSTMVPEWNTGQKMS